MKELAQKTSRSNEDHRRRGNREIAAHIAKALKELGFKRTYVHVGPLHTLWLDDILRAGQAVNYLFLDLCGQFTTHVARWILFNQHRFAFDAVIAATYTIQKRCNPLLDAIYAGRFMIVGRLPGNRTLFMLKTNVREWTRTTLFGHIAVLEQNYNVEVLDCIEYNDTSPMVMIRCQLGGSRRRTSAVTQAFNTLAGDLLRVNPELPTAASPKPRSSQIQSPKRGSVNHPCDTPQALAVAAY